jgi:hypothetical protein
MWLKNRWGNVDAFSLLSRDHSKLGVLFRVPSKSPDGWQSLVRFPFIQVGTPGVFNTVADFYVLGSEARPPPDCGEQLV